MSHLNDGVNLVYSKKDRNRNESFGVIGSWSPCSWKRFKAQQQPVYEDEEKVEEQLKIIRTLPSIVNADEIESLRRELEDCENGKCFFLQMGDCAERFDELDSEFLTKKIKAITAAARVFASRLGKPCLKIGRIAG